MNKTNKEYETEKEFLLIQIAEDFRNFKKEIDETFNQLQTQLNETTTKVDDLKKYFTRNEMTGAFRYLEQLHRDNLKQKEHEKNVNQAKKLLEDSGYTVENTDEDTK